MVCCITHHIRVILYAVRVSLVMYKWICVAVSVYLCVYKA